ncbi:MAG: PEP-CTERM sorting domain-containing protein [Planctomycetota bacterium]|nr:PEP-CTERM sorting domain-containing protein [Planctomycetota bacterium]
MNRSIDVVGNTSCSHLRRRLLSLYRLSALVVPTLLATTTPARAADVTSTWIAADGKWNGPANWSNNPTSLDFPNNVSGGLTYDAIIDDAGPSYTVTLDGDVAVNSLLLNSSIATLNHTAGAFSANTTIGAGTYYLNGGTISGGIVKSSGAAQMVVGPGGGWGVGGWLINGVVLQTDVLIPESGNWNGRFLNVKDGLTLDGKTIRINCNDYGASVLSFSGSQTFGGTGGQVVFDGNNSQVRAESGKLTIGPGITIRTGIAGGTVGQANTQLLNQGTISAQTAGATITVTGNAWTNQGTFEAKDGGTLTLAGSYWANNGVISVDGGTVRFDGTFKPAAIGTITRTGGSLQITGTMDNGGSTWTLDPSAGSFNLAGGTILGGKIVTSTGAYLNATANGGLLKGVTLDGRLIMPNGTALGIQEGLTLSPNGKIFARGATLSFQGNQTLAGTGEVVFDDYTSGVYASTGTLTIGNGVTLRTGPGSGLVGQSSASIRNHGTIFAQTAGAFITIDGLDWVNEADGVLKTEYGTLTTASTWTNKGTISLDHGVLNLGGSFTFSSAAKITGYASAITLTGTLNNTGSSFLVDGSVGSWTINGGTVSGGTLKGLNGAQLVVGPADGWGVGGWLVDGVVLQTDVLIPESMSWNGRFLTVKDGLTLNGKTIRINCNDYGASVLSFSGSQTFDGAGGQVVFDGHNSQVRAESGKLSIGPGITIRTGIRGGTVGKADTQLLNQGTISAQTAGATISILGQTWTNRGTIEATNHAYLYADGNWTNESDGVMRAADGGFLILNGNWTNKGLIDVNSHLVVPNADDARYSLIADQIKAACDKKWDARGITSTAAKDDANGFTGLALLYNARLDGPEIYYMDGYRTYPGDVLVKYTWNGDANLDGIINADDYFLVDSGFISQRGTYQHGDFNYDGIVNADDYFLIDSAYIAQSAVLSHSHSPIPVPEPASLFGFAVASLFALTRRYPRTRCPHPV